MQTLRTLIAALALVSLSGCVLVITDDGVSTGRHGVSLGDDHGDRSDRRLADAVREALDQDADLRGADIKVRASDGLVSLRGRVQDLATVEKAIAAAKATPGVAKVRSRLVVEID